MVLLLGTGVSKSNPPSTSSKDRGTNLKQQPQVKHILEHDPSVIPMLLSISPVRWPVPSPCSMVGEYHMVITVPPDGEVRNREFDPYVEVG